MFCKNCGKEIGNEAKFCDTCGTQVGQVNNKPPNSQYSSYVHPTDNKVIFVLSYLGILFFLPLVVCPESSEGKFHANQGLSLLIVSVAGSIALSILTAIIWVLGFITGFFGLAMFILMVIGMVNAANGKQEPLPVIGTMFNIIK